MSDLQTSPIDSVKARRFVSEIDRCFDELDSERGSYMSRCKGIRERIKDWKDQAEASGIPRRGLNHLLKRRDLEGKLKAHEDDAERKAGPGVRRSERERLAQFSLGRVVASQAFFGEREVVVRALFL